MKTTYKEYERFVQLVKNSIKFMDSYETIGAPDMTLEQFVKKTQDELVLFEKWWSESCVDDPEVFPAKLTIGLWNEMFESFSPEDYTAMEDSPDKF